MRGIDLGYLPTEPGVRERFRSWAPGFFMFALCSVRQLWYTRLNTHDLVTAHSFSTMSQPSSDRDLQSQIRQIRYFQVLPPAGEQELLAAFSLRKYAAGEIIMLEGELPPHLYIVANGIVKISRVSQEGREYIMRLTPSGETFNEVGVLDGSPNPATATAHTDAALWQIGRLDLQRIAVRYPELGWALAEQVARMARHLVNLVEDLSMRTVKGRVARLLLDEAETSHGDVVPRLLTQEEMAARLGTVREMVGRALRSLAADGIIEFDRHRIVILDPERLVQEAEV
ncbi:MAG: Crp/Fnr family transcriptional regulator [Anaerolineae bacterium]|nr:Crp/Fnr family transcriptional regulator [Anaerolineae bacterium]MCB0199949.1 Crp/Fnr family transcriptional regulator [Anaerolineae bacterium]MCB0204571.1 Crp/Fnr family transcriptional regulator [Anaerolineae bacterium]MCB0254948.1 Crp/Fnr family transcriptional regulator [Anaerolineae bacterium]